jgi:hypothetical protein
MPIVLDGTNGITAPNVFGRNRIINGQGRINQRGYVSGTNTTVANQYTLDRWRVVTSGQNLTFTGSDAGRTMTAPAGGCEQVIEGANIEGGTYTINWTGTASCTVDGTSRTKGSSFTLSANTNVTVRFSNGTFTDVQLETGTIPTPFERLPIGDELARCQRYYYQLPTALVSGLQPSGVAGIAFAIQHPVKMRAIPSASLNANVTNANYVAASPTGAQWTMSGANIAFAAKTGTVVIALTPGTDVTHLYTTTATFSTGINTIGAPYSLGSLDAEL